MQLRRRLRGTSQAKPGLKYSTGLFDDIQPSSGSPLPLEDVRWNQRSGAFSASLPDESHLIPANFDAFAAQAFTMASMPMVGSVYRQLRANL